MATEVSIAASSLVYLFGQKFVPVARLTGETLVYGGAKVREKELAHTLLLSAFASLAQQGNLELKAGKKRRLMLFSSDVPLAKALTSPEGQRGQLERMILGRAGGGRVYDIVRGIIGKDLRNPWAHIISLVRSDLVEEGYFRAEQEERRGIGRLLGAKTTITALPERIAPLEGEADRLKGMLSAFQVQEARLYSMLQKEVTSGVKSRVYQEPETDAD